MSGFSVDDDALVKVGESLRRQADYCQEATSFLNKHASYEHSEGLVNILNQASQLAHETVDEWFKSAAIDSFTAAADCIDDAVAYYRNSDEESAADFDSAIDLELSGAAHVFASDGVPSGFTDQYNPVDDLSTPSDYHDHDDYKSMPNGLDFIGILSFARATIMGATGLMGKLGIGDGVKDPHDAWAVPLSGNWYQVKANGEVMASLAEFCSQMAANIHTLRVQTAEVWTGRAADLFDLFLHRLETAFKQAQPQLVELANIYDSAAEAMVKTRKNVILTVELLVDLAIAFLAAAKAAKVGMLVPAVGLTLTAAVFGIGMKIIKTLGKLWVAYQAADNNVTGSAQQVSGLGQIRGASAMLPPLPQPDSSGMQHLPA